MRLLLDESLSARMAPALLAAGHDVVHVGDLGLLGASDDDVLAVPVHDRRHPGTADTDFGALLALSPDAVPSVLLLRRGGRSVSARTRQVLDALGSAGAALESGALAVVEHQRLRVRDLPIAPKD